MHLFRSSGVSDTQLTENREACSGSGISYWLLPAGDGDWARMTVVGPLRISRKPKDHLRIRIAIRSGWLVRRGRPVSLFFVLLRRHASRRNRLWDDGVWLRLPDALLFL